MTGIRLNVFRETDHIRRQYLWWEGGRVHIRERRVPLRGLPLPGRCVRCGCTDASGCPVLGGMCAWVNAERTWCSACDQAIQEGRTP